MHTGQKPTGPTHHPPQNVAATLDQTDCRQWTEKRESGGERDRERESGRERQRGRRRETIASSRELQHWGKTKWPLTGRSLGNHSSCSTHEELLGATISRMACTQQNLNRIREHCSVEHLRPISNRTIFHYRTRTM